MLGGMDNWLNRNADLEGEGNPLAKNTSQDIILEGNTDIFLNQFVTNMRGFRFNSLYGDKYFLLNAEIRWPIIKHLFGKRPLTSSFFRNLQIISFFDVGSAWSGKSPFDKNNNYNRQFFFQDNTFSGVVQTFRSPILTSYGLGLRSYLLGYYLKVDAARGIRDYFFQPWMFHLTLGHDF
jgi:outer membrane protein assembly factor BamA